MLWRCAAEAERAGRRKHRQHPQGRVTPGRTAVGRVPRRRRPVPPGSTLSTSLSLPRAPRHLPLFALPLPSGSACAPRRRARPPVVVQCVPTTSAVASSCLTVSRLLSRRCFSPHSSSMYQRSSNGGGGGGGGLYPTSLQHYFTSSPELVTQQQQQQSGNGGNIITSVAGSHMWSTGEYTQRLCNRYYRVRRHDNNECPCPNRNGKPAAALRSDFTADTFSARS